MSLKRYKRYCCVFGCLNEKHSKPELSFFVIPTDHERRLKWLKLIEREDLIQSSDSRVCEVHFNTQDVIVGKTRKMLKRNCLPCLHLPNLTKEVKNKRFEDGEPKSKRARLDTFEDPLDDYTEELYEFGKFVAEQLMCLDVEDARVAQAEIRALLSKFDVNKEIRCKEEPSTSNVQPATDEHRTVVTQAVTQVNPVVLAANQSGSEVNTAQPSLTQPVISQVLTTNPQVVLMPMNTDGSSATQSGLQVNTSGPSGAKSGQIFAPPLTKFAVLNVSTSASSSAPIGYIIEATTTGSRLNLMAQLESPEVTSKLKTTSVTQTESETSVEPAVTQTESETSVKPAVTQVESSLVIPAGPNLELEPESSSMIFDETLIKIEPESESLHSHVNFILPNLAEKLIVIKHEQDSEET